MNSKSNRHDAMKALGQYGSLGIDLFSNIFVGALLGYWLDKFTGKVPLFFIGGFILGAISGFYRIILLVKEEDSKNKRM